MQTETVRYIRRSEVRALLDCEAKWDFGYGDVLAGSSVEPLEVAEVLRLGTSWDTVVKSYNRKENVGEVLRHVYTGEDGRLPKLLLRYASSRNPMGTREVPVLTLPIDSGLQLAIEPDDIITIDGDIWLVEYKLRQSLTSIEYLYRDLQGMIYVWAARRAGKKVKGIIFDETLNESPSDMRYKKDGKPSKVQSCSPGEYAKGCISVGEDPDPDVLEKLESRVTHQRVPIEHYGYDLEGIPAMLDSAYEHIRLLESGRLYPKRIRNPLICRWCDYNRICEQPDPDLVDFTYSRRPPKRDRNDGYQH